MTDRTSLRHLFDEIVALIRETPVTTELEISDSDKLRMYGLYKQATEGNCDESQAPSRFQLVARAKYQAWLDCHEITTDKAMLSYVELASSHDHWLGKKCREKLLAWKEASSAARGDAQESTKDSSPPTNDVSQAPNTSIDHNASEKQDHAISSLQKTTRLYSWFDGTFGIRPLVPRGQLDISYRDIAFAAWQCMRLPSTLSRYCQLEEQVSHVWSASSDARVICGYSVRSLLDLYLRATAFPAGSEIIMSPPINIPGMMQVLKHHNITVVPVDLLNGNDECCVISANVDAIQKSVTNKTVAIMIVHPFGMISTTEQDMKSLRLLADEHNLHLLEDCAECFTGLGPDCYRGSKYVDASFFSFGTIKTATALGGGIAVLRHNVLKKVANKMNRMHHSLYKQQTAVKYLKTILWCLFVRFLADCPLLYGMLYSIVSFSGFDFDVIVSSSTKSFVSSHAGRGMQYMNQLRTRPPTALLAVLLRRLEQSKTVASSVQSRLQQSRYMAEVLKKVAPCVKVPVILPQSTNTYWLFPIQVDEPDAVSGKLREQGFDVPRGLSQLECIAKYSPNIDCCPRGDDLMNRILYLPVANRAMSKKDIRLLAAALNYATTKTFDSENERNRLCNVCQSIKRKAGRSFRRPNVSVLVAISAVILEVVFFQYVPLSQLLLAAAMFVFKLAWTMLSLFIVFAIIMRWTMADFYLNSSKCFAKYSSMLFDDSNESFKEASISELDETSQPFLNMETLTIPFLHGGDASTQDGLVLLTGATGFIGRLLLRDLLLHRKSLSISGGVVVLCRAKRGTTGRDRIIKLLNDPMYSFLSEIEKQNLVRVVEGDVTAPNVGLSNADMDAICNNMNITHVIHCAASVSFTQTLKDAAVSNITSSLNLQTLTSHLKSTSVRYIHISTAFVHGGMTGSKNNPLPKQLHTLGGYDAADLYRSMLGTEYRASAAMNELRFPNTYTFSKCVCEHLLSRNRNVKTVVVRPSIVGPALQQPYEGWAGDKPTTIVAAACLYMSYQWNLWCFGNHRVPYIPVDVVSRFILAKAFDMNEVSSRLCESPASCSDDGFERVSQTSDSSTFAFDNLAASTTSAIDSAQSKDFSIHNCTWDWKSSDSAMFTWIDYAFAVTHLGGALGHFSRLTAYIGLFVTVRILPGMNVRKETFATLHRILVQLPIDAVVACFDHLGYRPRVINRLSKLSAFLDLPLLFFSFMNNDFYFASDLVAPDELDGERYLFSCAAAAERFVSTIKALRDNKTPSRDSHDLSIMSLGGAVHVPASNDLFWALTQPRGNSFVRVAGWVFRKILRASSVDVTIDFQSFSRAAALFQLSNLEGSRPHIVLAPNHRSFFDFFLVSYLCFALPELHIDIPFIAAADDFERLPLLGWLATKANAFFVKRGRGKADPSLGETLNMLKDNHDNDRIVVEVFVEGSRSRDRRYLKPKTGFLRCLSVVGGEYVVVPIAINYEEIPEQTHLARDVDQGGRSRLNCRGLLEWLKKIISGNVSIGRIHIVAASPIGVNGAMETDFGVLAVEIQQSQQDRVYFSNYHIRTVAMALGLSVDTVSRALVAIGCDFWPDYTKLEECLSCKDVPVPPNLLSEQWMVLLHFGHKLSGFFTKSHPRWCKWLNEIGSESEEFSNDNLDPSVEALVKAIGRSFDKADDLVDKALAVLRGKGFRSPTRDHVVQSILSKPRDCPVLLVRAAVSFEIEGAELVSLGSCSDDEQLSVSPSSECLINEDQCLGFWGYRDSGFVLKMDQYGETLVTMKGDRYTICGKSLRKLIPFIEKETSTRIDPLNEPSFPSSNLVSIPCDLMDEDVDLLKSTFAMTSLSVADRVRHGSGHAQEEIYLIRTGEATRIRLPDAVVWPLSEDEVMDLVSLAKNKNWCLIPFGGGTNVSHATRCPVKDVESRPIISVDMKLMADILWVNEEDGLAHVQAGITGRALMEEMAQHGYTIGHQPDSIEFSTLGGWIATKASGMKRNKYGNIEDIVKSVRVAGSNGLLWRGRHNDDVSVSGRESRGMDLCSVAIGSEGSFGIITSAVVRIWPLPECQEHDSVVFPDFDHGLRFARDAARLGPNLPSSVRLLDNEHFRLGQALQGDSSLVERSLAHLWKRFHPVTRLCTPDSIVCATVLFEGTREEVQSQKRAIKSLASKHGGACVGSRIGKSGYELTFVIAYLRDFAMTYHFLAESFETFAPWSKVDSIIRATKERIKREHRLRSLPGEAFVGSRVTQLYHEGACLYFYFCMNIRGVANPSSVFAEIEHAARQEILDNGGSLSHHHGIGKLRADFVNEMDSDAYHSLILSLKQSVDPTNTFGVRNGALACSASEGEVKEEVRSSVP